MPAEQPPTHAWVTAIPGCYSWVQQRVTIRSARVEVEHQANADFYSVWLLANRRARRFSVGDGVLLRTPDASLRGIIESTYKVAGQKVLKVRVDR
jgi:hypothetical protein